MTVRGTLCHSKKTTCLPAVHLTFIVCPMHLHGANPNQIKPKNTAPFFIERSSCPMRAHGAKPTKPNPPNQTHQTKPTNPTSSFNPIKTHPNPCNPNPILQLHPAPSNFHPLPPPLLRAPPLPPPPPPAQSSCDVVEAEGEEHDPLHTQEQGVPPQGVHRDSVKAAGEEEYPSV
jgi:hypothetical protein